MAQVCSPQMRRMGFVGLAATVVWLTIAGSPGVHALQPRGVAAARDVRELARYGLNVSALRGVVVWEGRRGGRSVLMRRVNGRSSRIPGVRSAPLPPDLIIPGSFRNVDLGLDRRDRVVAVYQRCGFSARTCRGPFVVNVRSGGERRLALDVPTGCGRSFSERPFSVSVWRDRVAYAWNCGRGRSGGVYVARDGHSRRLMALPPAARWGIVDLAGRLLAGATDDGIWVASGTVPGCRTVVASLPRNVDNVGVVAQRRGVWWGFSTAGDFGGNINDFASVTVGSRCAVIARQALSFDAFGELNSFTGTFAIDGSTLYVADAEAGVRAGPLQEATPAGS
jgi:hypothetical protein